MKASRIPCFRVVVLKNFNSAFLSLTLVTKLSSASPRDELLVKGSVADALEVRSLEAGKSLVCAITNHRRRVLLGWPGSGISKLL